MSPEEEGQERDFLRDGRRVCQATRPVTGKEGDDYDDDMFLLVFSVVNNLWISCSVAKEPQSSCACLTSVTKTYLIQLRYICRRFHFHYV
jgi:hypothetical protein